MTAELKKEIRELLHKLQFDYYEHGARMDTIVPDSDIKNILAWIEQKIDEDCKRDSIILTTDQICQIAGFAGLNIDNPNLDEFEIEYTVDKSDKGLFIWTTEYPEEGSLNLSPSPKESDKW